MKALSSDTDPKAEAVWIGLLRRASCWKRLRAALSLTTTTRQLSWDALERRYPEESEQQRKRRFIELIYGEDLARRVMPGGEEQE